MTLAVLPRPTQARALLLFPSGQRVYAEDLLVDFPCPAEIHLYDPVEHYRLFHLHHAGEVDHDTRALYVLGGTYRPHGGTPARLEPSEAYEQ